MNESLYDILMNLQLPNLIGVVIAFYFMTRGMRTDIREQSKRSDKLYELVAENQSKVQEEIRNQNALLQSFNARLSRMEGFMWADMEEKMKVIKGK